jgi:predicted ATPase/transcriptional regulator with XRE-family HTH domain
MDERLSFGAVLKRLRLAAGLTHEALAERASLGARTISDLERGISRAPRADTLALLVNGLGLSPEQKIELERAARASPSSATGESDPSRSVGNLPVHLTRFVGREYEGRRLFRLLSEEGVRLVTLTGPGGVGKTRLALRVASQMHEQFPDGVFVAALASAADVDSAIQAISRALSGDTRHQTMASVTALLAGKKLLLVLDNCEHLTGIGPRVADLLRLEPRLSALATSRAPLRISGEQEFPVAPLPVPDLKHLPSIPQLTDFAAVELFLDRAVKVRPDFALTAENADSVAAICANLDGLPLAVELAAARIRALPPRVLLERLGDATQGGSLRLLTGGARDLPERHQTLRDTIAWSHNLLEPKEQCLLRRLAVFAGGCTLEAAETICGEMPGDKADTLDCLFSLLDNSLLVEEEGPDGEPRFLMLETIRAYAWERLVEAGEAPALQRQHANYYLAIVEATKGLLFAGAGARNRAAAEQGNVQAALRWLVQQG